MAEILVKIGAQSNGFEAGFALRPTGDSLHRSGLSFSRTCGLAARSVHRRQPRPFRQHTPAALKFCISEGSSISDFLPDGGASLLVTSPGNAVGRATWRGRSRPAASPKMKVL
jgi:hypothetical protein